eukprot:909707-Alexandrium_andersonii.AAC.1
MPPPPRTPGTPLAEGTATPGSPDLAGKAKADQAERGANAEAEERRTPKTKTCKARAPSRR